MENEPNPNRELFDARWRLQLNACHLADVRDAQKAITEEWDALQEERAGIISRIQELQPDEV